MEKERITQVIVNFVKGGDNSDVALLEKVLHPDFRVASNNFMGNPGVKIIDRKAYISNVKEGVFGGLPREMEILSIDESSSIASVKIRLKSEQNNFVSYNLLVLDSDNEWRLIHNLAIVEAIS